MGTPRYLGRVTDLAGVINTRAVWRMRPETSTMFTAEGEGYKRPMRRTRAKMVATCVSTLPTKEIKGQSHRGQPCGGPRQEHWERAPHFAALADPRKLDAQRNLLDGQEANEAQSLVGNQKRKVQP